MPLQLTSPVWSCTSRRCLLCLLYTPAWCATLPLLKKQGSLEGFMRSRRAVSSHHNTREEKLHLSVAFCLRCGLLAMLTLPSEEQLYALRGLSILRLLTQADGRFVS